MVTAPAPPSTRDALVDAPNDIPGPHTVGFWARAVKAHQRIVVVRLLAAGFTLDRAQELAQETWTRLIEQDRLGRLLDVSLPGLAIRQAMFLAQDALRQANRSPACSADLEAIAATGCQELRVLARDALRRAAQVLESMPDMAQTVFRLAYGRERHTAAEIAERVGLSTQRVRQTLCEVRRRLAEVKE
jgi:RNA polymerase sigma-70 factor (ECF subfamily)